MKTTLSKPFSFTPRVPTRLAQLLDAISEDCTALAHSNDVSRALYASVLRDVETVATIVRENETPRASGDAVEWGVARSSITMKAARAVIEALRSEDALRHDVQRAIG